MASQDELLRQHCQVDAKDKGALQGASTKPPLHPGLLKNEVPKGPFIRGGMVLTSDIMRFLHQPPHTLFITLADFPSCSRLLFSGI